MRRLVLLPIAVVALGAAACLPPELPGDGDGPADPGPDVRLGAAEATYQDPEMLPGHDLLSFIDADGSIWLAELDPRTGTLVSADGRDTFVDDEVTPFGSRSLHGKSFGLDASGWSVIYVKETGGTDQVWRATPTATGFVREPLTSGPAHHTALASTDPTRAATQIYAVQGPLLGPIVWFDEDDPDDPQAVTPSRPLGVTAWHLPGTDSFVTGAPDAAGVLQVLLVDTATGARRFLTSGSEDAKPAVAWRAPELGDVPVVTAVVGDDQLVALAETAPGTWEVVADIGIPEGTQMSLYNSPEPFVAGNRSYLALLLTDAERAGDGPGEIWWVGLDGSAARCDTGASGEIRVEPEPYVSEQGSWIVYSVVQDGRWEPWRCETGLGGQPAPEPAPAPPPSTGDDACTTMPVTGEGVTPTSPHVVCTPGGDPRGELLVFFPGTGGRPDQYEELISHVASLGYHAIGLSYRNEESVNLQVCPRSPDPSCHGTARFEILLGWDVSPLVDVSVADSAVVRLTRLLGDLHDADPAAGWDAYLVDGAPDWPSIAVSGHSQGGGHAFFLASHVEVARAVPVAWVDVHRGELAPWITSAPMATPAERIFFLEHPEDGIPLHLRREIRSFVGLDAFGPEVVVEESAPPYGGTHQLFTVSPPAPGAPEPRPGAGFHNAPVVDEYLGRTPTGEPVLLDAWTHLFTG